MPSITIYTTSTCPYCHAAKRLLDSKAARYEEIDVTGKPALREEMRKKAGGRYTVPQIWIGSKHVGGCDDLHELDDKGGLDPLLAESSGP